MAGTENYFWHKVHSLTGIIPVGFYLVQHLTLNSFSLAGPNAYNGVIAFFEHLPFHVLVVLKYGVVWLPLIFHSVYGFIIASRADYDTTAHLTRYREDRYFLWQRLTGLFAIVFLCYHMATTSIASTLKGANETIYYATWADHLKSFGGLVLVFYVLGIAASTYHLSYGIWNFCIRWGITISERAQQATAKFSAGAFVVLTLLGWLALAGFFWTPLKRDAVETGKVEVQAPSRVVPVSQ